MIDPDHAPSLPTTPGSGGGGGGVDATAARPSRHRPYRGAGLLWMASVAPGLATFFWLLPRHFLSASAGNIAVLAIATLAVLILIVAVLWGVRVVLGAFLIRSGAAGARVALLVSGAIGVVYDVSVFPRSGGHLGLIALALLEILLVLAASAATVRVGHQAAAP